MTGWRTRATFLAVVARNVAGVTRGWRAWRSGSSGWCPWSSCGRLDSAMKRFGDALSGLLHRLHRGVFAVGHLSLVPHARLVAALLACGLDFFISHRTAAAVWGLRVLATRRIEVTVPHTRRAVRAGLTLHRTSHPPAADDLAIRNGLRVSSVPRLLLELAGRERPSELDRLNPQAVRKRVLVVAAVERGLTRYARYPGSAGSGPPSIAIAPTRSGNQSWNGRSTR